MGANAQTSVPTFTSGQVLTAAQQNLINTGVPVAAGTAERDDLFGGADEKTLAEGQLVYVESLNVVQYYTGAAWATVGPTTSAVLQIVSTTKTDTFSMSSTTYADVTGLSVSITPSSASSRVLIIANLTIGTDPNNSAGAYPRLMRDSTAIAVGATAGNRISSSGDGSPRSTTSIETVAFNFVDSPAATSATTYKIQVRSQTANNVHVNRSDLDSDTATFSRTASTITVMEIV
jgi:hypothetical protein